MKNQGKKEAKKGIKRGKNTMREKSKNKKIYETICPNQCVVCILGKKDMIVGKTYT